MRISDWSADVCSSDLLGHRRSHELEDLGAGARVEVSGRLVGEDDLRARREGAGHSDTLLLAAGELARPMGEAVSEADGADDRVEPALIGLAAGEVHGERDVLHGVQRGDEVEALEEEAHLVATRSEEHTSELPSLMSN